MAEEKSPIAKREEEILEFWKSNDIFKKTLKKEAPKGEFVFFEGPPTANGRPGIHHLEARAFKDAIPRYKTMQGFHVRRKGGWDTHGLPVELEVEKQLGLKSKKEIEKYGVEKFNKHCKESVWKYVNEWQEFTERMGYWIDLEDPYITYESKYIESVWNILKKVHERDLLYKDYKVVPWCPRCGTVLSSHELAQGYADVKDLSVYAKFKATDKEEYFLAWTTTPWTLPGNVALAVGEDIEYVKVEIEGDIIILAKERLEEIAPEAEIKETLKGKDLIERSYEPLYPFLKDNLPETEKEKLSNAFKIYKADFVTTEDGSGIVHTAVMYGQDDFELGNEVGLPKYHLVNDSGIFTEEAGFLSGKFVKDEEVAVDIIKDLHGRGLLLKKEKYEHTYPFCWRCKTPLIYYARDSWYIRMSSLRDELVKENQEINWEPEYIKDGRFGEWLREVKDWAISRERYWGTPLPVWMSEDGEEMEVIGSFDEIQEKSSDKIAKIYFMRHGLSEKNELGIYDSSLDKYGLTEEGKKQAKEAAKKLKEVNLVVTSPVRRAKETAEIVAKELGLELLVEEGIKEVSSGKWEHKDLDDPSIQKSREEYYALSGEEHYKVKRGETGDSWKDVVDRGYEAVTRIIKENPGKKILFVTHAGPWGYIMKELKHKSFDQARDLSPYMSYALPSEVYIDLNTLKALDPHKPFIDEITYEKNGKVMRRVPEVMDVWFDSGAMPFAQDHYPFDSDVKYPADFISEAIDQTRGWFYTLHAVGALMGKGKAYKNVISLGHILDSEGQKMSKSKGNTINPWEAMDKYGVDALRFWMYSVNQPGEPKNFDEKTVDEIVKKVFNLLLNVVTFYNMAEKDVTPTNKSNNVLDKWIISYLNKLKLSVEDNLDNYKLLEASRDIREFVGDLSQWYIRRSRDRFRDGDEEALGTTRFVLLELSKIIAPFMPFLAEDVYKKLKGEKESVHLEDWPESGEVDTELLEDMKMTRDAASKALEMRAKANIKVRQPLQKLWIPHDLSSALKEVIADEVNVKEVIHDKDFDLDINITQELEEEGDMREVVRAIQGLRKKAGLNPSDEISLRVSADGKVKNFIEKFSEEIIKPTNVKEFIFEEGDGDSIKLSIGSVVIDIV